MISIAIKNAILLILIVLILHFMLRDMRPRSGSSTSIKNTSVEQVTEGYDMAPPNASSPAPATGQIITSTNAVVSNSNEEEELMNYVMTLNINKMEEPTKGDANPILTTKKSEHVSMDTQKLSNAMLIGSYNDENPMNGGNLFAGLSGYDSNEMVYEPFGASI